MFASQTHKCKTEAAIFLTTAHCEANHYLELKDNTVISTAFIIEVSKTYTNKLYNISEILLACKGKNVAILLVDLLHTISL